MDPSNNTRVQSAVDLPQTVIGNPAIQQAFRDLPVTKEQFVTRFGNQATANANTLSSLIDILPAGSMFANVNELVDV